MKSTEIKYIELIRDLTPKKDFQRAIRNYRAKLGIPPNGFTSDKLEMAFVSEGKIDLLEESVKPVGQLQREYRNDKVLLEKVLQWKDLLGEGEGVLSILRSHHIPPRAAYMLFFFILYCPQYLKDLETKLYRKGELQDYGCELHYTPIFDIKSGSQDWPADLVKEKPPHVYDDLAATIYIYPEAKKSDVIRMIDECWDDKIKPIQLAKAKKSNLRIDNVRTKLLRDKYAKIYRLHQKGLTSRQIAQKINLQNEGSWEYVRKAISIAKKREK